MGTLQNMASGSVEEAINLLTSNPPATFNTAAQTIATLLQNVIRNPGEEKFRTIHNTNPAIQSRLFAVPGGREFIIAAGFVPEGELLVFYGDDTAPIIEAMRNLEAAIMAGITLLQNAAQNSRMEQALLN